MKHKTVMIFGDSYSTYEGCIPEGYAVYYSGHREKEPDVSSADKSWWGRLLRATNSTLVQNNSWSGSTIGYTGYNNADCSSSSSFIYRFRKLKGEGFFENNKIDTLFVFGGTNDSWSGAPLGEFKYDGIEENDLYCVLPAIAHFAEQLSVTLTDTKIVFIANCDIKSELTDAMRSVCERYGFVYISLSGIDKLNGHPTELGMKQICEQVLAGIE